MRSTLVAALLLIAPTATAEWPRYVYQFYPGQARPAAEVARLEMEAGVRLVSIETRELLPALSNSGPDVQVELLPGRYGLSVEYASSREVSLERQTLVLQAGAGGAYKVNAHVQSFTPGHSFWSPAVERMSPSPRTETRSPYCFLVDEGIFTVTKKQSLGGYQPLYVKGADGVERSFTGRRPLPPEHYVGSDPAGRWSRLLPGELVQVYTNSCDDHQHAVRYSRVLPRPGDGAK